MPKGAFTSKQYYGEKETMKANPVVDSLTQKLKTAPSQPVTTVSMNVNPVDLEAKIRVRMAEHDKVLETRPSLRGTEEGHVVRMKKAELIWVLEQMGVKS